MSLASFHAAFAADDHIVDIVPDFDYNQRLSLLSCPEIPRLKAGIATKVPLWLAVFLQQRRLCSIAVPQWLSTENLAKIIQQERQEALLLDDPDRLPADYYQVARCLATRGALTDPAVSLLIEDLFQVRMDKLRQQFQKLLSESTEPDLVVSVNGIGAGELAVLRDFVQQALTDQRFLHQTLGGKDKGESEDGPVDKAPPALRSRLPVRRFRG